MKIIYDFKVCIFLSMDGIFFDLKKKFIQMIWIFNGHKGILVRLRVKLVVSEGCAEAGISYTILES